MDQVVKTTWTMNLHVDDIYIYNIYLYNIYIFNIYIYNIYSIYIYLIYIIYIYIWVLYGTPLRYLPSLNLGNSFKKGYHMSIYVMN